jgi:hypothetical protein
MPFQPGNSANPNGRPVGSRNKRTKELFDKLEARGDKDPIDFLSEIVTTHPDPQLRIQAAGLLTPYKHSKQSPLPVPRYVEHPITLPDFVAVEDAEAFLGKIPQLVAAGELDFQSGLDLSTMTRAWLSAKYERDEMKLKMLAANADPNPTITIKGGLPPLPGTSVIMPQLNGHLVNDTTLPLGPPDNGPCEPSSDARTNESVTNDSPTRAPSHDAK